MSEFLDTLKERATESQRRLQIALARFQQAQADHGAAAQEHASWMNAVNAEMRREQLQEQLLQSGVPSSIGESPKAIQSAPPGEKEAENDQTPPPVVEINKTQLIRDVLQQHPTGIRPVGVWLQVREQVARPYVYSVLSRMKEKKQVVERRGKYFLQVSSKPEESKEIVN